MATSHESQEQGLKFLLALYAHTQGDCTKQMSLYAIGAELGLERDQAQQVAQELMGQEWLDIRTLSGGIGLTAAGHEQAERLGAGGSAAMPTLGSKAILDEERRSAVESLVAGVREKAASLRLAFEGLAELVADVRSIEAQLASPRPKSAVLRECLRSIAALLQSGGAAELAGRVKRFSGD